MPDFQDIFVLFEVGPLSPVDHNFLLVHCLVTCSEGEILGIPGTRVNIIRFCDGIAAVAVRCRKRDRVVSHSTIGMNRVLVG